MNRKKQVAFMLVFLAMVATIMYVVRQIQICQEASPYIPRITNQTSINIAVARISPDFTYDSVRATLIFDQHELGTLVYEVQFISEDEVLVYTMYIDAISGEELLSRVHMMPDIPNISDEVAIGLARNILFSLNPDFSYTHAEALLSLFRNDSKLVYEVQFKDSCGTILHTAYISAITGDELFETPEGWIVDSDGVVMELPPLEPCDSIIDIPISEGTGNWIALEPSTEEQIEYHKLNPPPTVEMPIG